MSELNELIAEGELIRSAVADSLEPEGVAKITWHTVVHWYSEGFAYAQGHSARPFKDFPEYLDPHSEKSVHFEQIDRLLNRLRAIHSSTGSA